MVMCYNDFHTDLGSDETEGKRVCYMKSIRNVLLLLSVMMCMMVGGVFTASAEVPIPAKEPGEKVQKVKTLAWTAKLRRSVKTKYGTYKAGTKVIVVRPGRKCIVQIGKHQYKIGKSALRLISGIVTSVTDGDYNVTTKLAYVNRKKIASRTKFLIWVSLDKQRVNVYYGKAYKWKLIRVMRCTTGRGSSTPIGYFTIGWKEHPYKTLTNYMEYSGSGFHKWPHTVPGCKKLIGNVVTNTLGSYGCIRVDKKDSYWMFAKIPVHTKVVIF